MIRHLKVARDKWTGSYYTPPELVRELIKSALEPIIADRLGKAASDYSSTFLFASGPLLRIS